MNRIQIFLTRYVWLIGKKYCGVQTFHLEDNTTADAIIYEEKRFSGTAGQLTIFNTIILNKIIMNSAFRAERYLTHELMHKKQWYRFALYPLMAIAYFAGLLLCISILYLLYIAIAAILMSRVVYTPQDIPTALLSIVLYALIIVMACGYSWFIEYKAEAGTFKRLGIDRVVAIDNEFQPPNKVPAEQRIINRMLHPTKNITERIYRHFNRN